MGQKINQLAVDHTVAVLLEKIKDFWGDKGVHRRYVDHGPLQVYVRRVIRRVDGPLIECLDLAGFMLEPEGEGLGLVTKLVCEVEKLGLPIYIENVTQKRFWGFWEGKGYDLVYDDTHMRCYYLPPHRDAILHFQFKVTLSGEGFTEGQAWADAVDSFCADPGEPHSTEEVGSE